MYNLEPQSFIDKLKGEDTRNFLVKIETAGLWFTTQDERPFYDAEYKTPVNPTRLYGWLTFQEECARKNGGWEEITEIWRFDNDDHTHMTLIWSKEKGWLYEERANASI